MCIAQIQLSKHELYHAEYTNATWEHELDHTYQESIFPEKICMDEMGIGDLSDVFNI